MDALQKNIAVTRGEAMAASLLATAAIQAVLALTADREDVLARIGAAIDETLNMSGPGRGDPNDEFNTQVRETARFCAMQALDHIADVIRQAKGRT
jgi:hypothetical protein